MRPIDILACQMLIWLGWRPSEFGKVRKRDIDFERKVIVLRETKSRDDQETPIPDQLVDDLRKTVSQLKQDDFVFTNKSGRPMSRKHIENIFKQYASERGVRNATPQILRRSLADIIEDCGATSKQVESLLRHVGFSTNRKHYSKPKVSAAREALKHHPANDL